MSEQRDLWTEVIADMESRRRKGIKTYGKPVDPEDTENWLKHAFEEFLDGALYCKAAEEVVAKLRDRITELEEKLQSEYDSNEWLTKELEYMRNKYEPQDN